MTRRKAAEKALRIPSPAVQFTVDPEHGFPFAVLIFRTRGQMRRYLSHSRPDIRHQDDWAFTDQQRREVVLCFYTCTDNIVAHEMAHAVNWWAAWIGLTPELMVKWGHPTHERVAEALGNLVSQFWRKFAEAGCQRQYCWGFRR